jgi:uncharacterized protein (DUF433 family)
LPKTLELECYTTEQVIRVTGVTKRRLEYWLNKSIVTADIDMARGRGRVRLWSFRNLVEVRVALWLRDSVSLQLIAKIVKRIRQRGVSSPLSTLQWAVVKRSHTGRADVVVQWHEGEWAHPLSGQIVFHGVLPLQQFGEELTEAVADDRTKRRKAGSVEQRRGALGSKPVFAGTRIPVETVVRLHAAGWKTSRILKNYPGLTMPDVEAALAQAR